MIASAVLAGLAVAALLARPGRDGSPAVTALPVLAAAGSGLAVWLVVGGLPGTVLGGLAALAVPRLLERWAVDPADDLALAADLPLALDLLGACLAGGAPPVGAVAAVAQAFPGPCGDRLGRVASALSLGALPSDAWSALGDGRDAAGAAARALARAAEGGAPVASTVRRVAADARTRQRGEQRRRAARVGVLAVLPLGGCFLPAFVLLGVVPTVIGLAAPLLHTLG